MTKTVIEISTLENCNSLRSSELRNEASSGHWPGTEQLLARVNGREAGVISFFETDAGESCHLHEVFVLSAYRRRGVGKALVERALEMARSRNYKLVTLLVRPKERSVSAQVLQRWYERYGFAARISDGEEMALSMPEIG
jgi:GNAT superfamily N-acetyltransferase